VLIEFVATSKRGVCADIGRDRRRITTPAEEEEQAR